MPTQPYTVEFPHVMAHGVGPLMIPLFLACESTRHRPHRSAESDDAEDSPYQRTLWSLGSKGTMVIDGRLPMKVMVFYDDVRRYSFVNFAVDNPLKIEADRGFKCLNL